LSAAQHPVLRHKQCRDSPSKPCIELKHGQECWSKPLPPAAHQSLKRAHCPAGWSAPAGHSSSSRSSKPSECSNSRSACHTE
jgi:hypothetical protein